MSNENWTPGPWRVGVADSASAMHCVDGNNSDGHAIEICEVWGTQSVEEETEESRANVNLIAAATELYEALDGLVDWIDDMPVGDGYNRANKSRSALAKARGEQ